MTNEATIVFKEICRLSQNWGGWDVFFAKSIAESVGLSVYKTRKALHELWDLALVEKASQGCPAIESQGEYRELICEAAPPINGWSVTSPGTETEIYKQAEKNYLKSLEDWANGAYDDDEEEEGEGRMKRYLVTGSARVICTMEVDAESKEQAIETANYEFGGLCNYVGMGRVDCLVGVLSSEDGRSVTPDTDPEFDECEEITEYDEEEEESDGKTD